MALYSDIPDWQRKMQPFREAMFAPPGAEIPLGIPLGMLPGMLPGAGFGDGRVLPIGSAPDVPSSNRFFPIPDPGGTLPPFLVDAPGGSGPDQQTQPAPVPPSPLLQREPFDIPDITLPDPPPWTESGSSYGGGGFRQAMPGWLPTAAGAIFGPLVGAGVGLMGQPRLDENLVYQNQMRAIAGLDPVKEPEGFLNRSFGWLTGDDPRPRSYQEGFGDIESEMVARNKANYEEARRAQIAQGYNVAPWSDVNAVEGARQQFGAATMGQAGVGNIGGTFGRPGAGFGDEDGWTTGGIPGGLDIAGGESGYGTRNAPTPSFLTAEARQNEANTTARIDAALDAAGAFGAGATLGPGYGMPNETLQYQSEPVGAPDRTLLWDDLVNSGVMSAEGRDAGQRSWNRPDAMGMVSNYDPIPAALADVPNQFDFSVEGGGFGIPGMSAARYGMDYALPDVGGYGGAGFGGGGGGTQDVAWW